MAAENENENENAFKHWFDRKAAKLLAAQMKRGSRSFDEKKFIHLAGKGLGELEFNQRVQQFSNALRETLPKPVPKALQVIRKGLPPVLPNCETPTDGYLQWPVGQFIANHGLDHFDESMETMIEVTQRFSSEFAVRPFVEAHPEKSFKKLLSLTSHASPHVRRWCSEGTRTRLPWGRKLTALVGDPGPIWPILEALKDDDELYVRRSVANNLNDIAKDHPDLVVKRCKEWLKQPTEHRQWLVKHALRKLVKDGHPAALALQGFRPPKGIDCELRASPKRVKIGNAVQLTATLSSSHSRTQKLMVDFAIHYVRKGKKTSAKVFKWKTLELAAKSEVTLEKKHSLKETSIRALYPGAHKVEVQVNGVRIAESDFKLLGA